MARHRAQQPCVSRSGQNGGRRCPALIVLITRFHFRPRPSPAKFRARRCSLKSVFPGDTGMLVSSAPMQRSLGWRTPAVVVVCGCLIALLSFGPRSSLGFFLTPMSQANGWGRDVFALALAVQKLLWGIGQPLAGAVADRFGAHRVLSVGAVLYAAGLYLMAQATTTVTLELSAGVLIGFGLSGCAFNMVIGAFAKLLPESWRSLAFGAGTAAGSFGQFLFAPLAVSLIDGLGWQQTLVTFGAVMLLVLPLSLALATGGVGQGAAGAPQSLRQALA